MEEGKPPLLHLIKKISFLKQSIVTIDSPATTYEKNDTKNEIIHNFPRVKRHLMSRYPRKEIPTPASSFEYLPHRKH